MGTIQSSSHTSSRYNGEDSTTWRHSQSDVIHKVDERDDSTHDSSPSSSPATKLPLYLMRSGSSNLKRMRLPKKIILVRHGESLGNVEESAYSRIPDWKIPLTEKGKLQARKVGIDIKELIKDEPIAVYCSPYLRTKQTLFEMMKALKDNPLIIAREEPRLTEQQFGNFQHTQHMNIYKNDRSRFGRFYYRFPQGEAGLDVFNRVTLFIGTLFREWERENSSQKLADTNIIIVTHGLTLRLFLMRWFHYSVTEFEKTDNPRNGAIVVLSRECAPSSHQFVPGSGLSIGSEEMMQEYFTMDQESINQMNFRHLKESDTDKARENLNILLEEARISELESDALSKEPFGIPINGTLSGSLDNNIIGVPHSSSSGSFGSIYS